MGTGGLGTRHAAARPVGRLPGPRRVSGSIPADLDKAPAFREPWQAKAFAFVVLLHREGHFTWDDWVRTLADEIAVSPQRADEDAEFAYHRQFLTALEKIVATRGLTAPEAMQARKLACGGHILRRRMAIRSILQPHGTSTRTM